MFAVLLFAFADAFFSTAAHGVDLSVWRLNAKL
jgi:hypothetical protein